MEIRPITQAERHYLKQYFGASINECFFIYLNLLFGLGLLTFFAFLIVKAIAEYVIFPMFDVLYSQTFKPYFVVLSMLIVLALCRDWIPSLLRFHSKSNQTLHDILKHNQAEVHTLHIQKAAELSEYNDEGIGFFLETNENKVLFVGGQDLYAYGLDYEEEEPASPADKPYGAHFPSTRIVLTRENSKGIRLNLQSDGTALDKIIRLEEKSFFIKKGKQRHYAGPEDGSFYSGTLNEVLAHFAVKIVS